MPLRVVSDGMQIKKFGLGLSLTLLLALGLTACADEPGGTVSAPDSDANTASGAPENGADRAEQSEDESTQKPEPKPDTVKYAEPAECIVGTWVTDLGFFFDTVTREYGEVDLLDVEGDIQITFGADDKMTTIYDTWLLTFQAEGQTAKVGRDGTDTGTYSVTDSLLSFSDRNINSKVIMNIAGMEMQIEPTPDGYENVPFSCSATELELTVNGQTHLLTRK